MFLRKNAFNLIFLCTLIFLLGYLIFFLFAPKALACTENWECPDNPGPNECCNNDTAVCNNLQSGICSNGICTFGIGRPKTHIDDCNAGRTCGGYCYDDACYSNTSCSNPSGCEGDWRYDCTTNNCSPDVPDACVGRPQQCRSGTWVTTNEAGECTTECTNCSHVGPTPTPTPSPSPPPGVCENNCGGLGPCGFRRPDGSCTTDNSCCHRICSGGNCITIEGGGSNACDNDAQCSGPTPTPSPTPPGSCSPSVNMRTSPSPVIAGSNITFIYDGDGQSSLCVYDTLTGGVGVGVPEIPPRSCANFDIEYPMSRSCVTTTAGSYNWTHYWWYNNSCPLVPNRCKKTIPYTITTPAPAIAPWIQVTGDVHSNGRINAPGGP